MDLMVQKDQVILGVLAHQGRQVVRQVLILLEVLLVQDFRGYLSDLVHLVVQTLQPRLEVRLGQGSPVGHPFRVLPEDLVHPFHLCRLWVQMVQLARPFLLLPEDRVVPVLRSVLEVLVDLEFQADLKYFDGYFQNTA